MSCQKVKRFRIVEVTSAGQNNTLNDEKVLDGAKRITAIEAYMVGDVAKGPSGAATVNDTIFKKSFLTLSTGESNEVLLHVPLTDLCKKTNAGQLFLVDLPPISATKSKVYIAELTGLVTTETFVLAFHYES